MALRNNGTARSARRIAIFALLFDIVSFGFQGGLIFVAIGHDANSLTECTSTNGLCPSNPSSVIPLGQWSNMPPSSSCSPGNVSFTGCELLGNSSYRGILKSITSSGESGFSVGLQAGCITPSNTAGAILQLQYANYSDTTHTNSSKFVNVGPTLPIDNSANWPCPGTLESGSASLPSMVTNPTVFIFRVVGMNGGGAGDNPRFSFVSVYVIQTARNSITGSAFGISTVHFTGVVTTNYPLPAASTTENFQWFATNTTSTGCGFVTDNCWEHGTSSCAILVGASQCSVVVNFAVTFTGTPGVIVNPTNIPGIVSLAIGTIGLLYAQTLTV